MPDAKHRHKWESVMTHHHGGFIMAEIKECECGAEQSSSTTSKPFNMLKELCPDCA